MEFKRFGIMLDCSRNAVMKVEQIKKFIDYMVMLGYNALELYTEDTFCIIDEPYFGHLRGRYSANELKEIDFYAKSKGVELIPCIQTLAHYHTLLKNHEYADIADMGDVLLVDEPKTYQLIDKIFKTMAECFTSREINIGMDEARFLGLGKHLKIHGYQRAGDIFLRHLTKIVEIADKYGFNAHMWYDMLFKTLSETGDQYCENFVASDSVKDKLPKNVELAYWDYYSSNKSRYDNLIKGCKSFDKPVWFFGGCWSWCGFAPQWEKTIQNMLPAVQSAIENKIDNFFVCLWGDGGKECSFFANLPLLHTIMQYSKGIFDEKTIAKSFEYFTKLNYYDFKQISNLDGKKQGVELYTSSMHLYNDPLLGINDYYVLQNGAVDYKGLQKELEFGSTRAGEFSYIFDLCASLANVLEIKYDFGVRLTKCYLKREKSLLTPFIAECDLLVLKIEDFYQKFKTLWYKENKPFGFEVHTLQIGGLIQRIKDCKMRILDYISENIDCIEELEQERLPFHEYDGTYFGLTSAGRQY